MCKKCKCKEKNEEEKDEVVVINSAEELIELLGLDTYDDCNCTEYDDKYDNDDEYDDDEYFDYVINISNMAIATLGNLAKLEEQINGSVNKSFYNNCIKEIKLDLMEVI